MKANEVDTAIATDRSISAQASVKQYFCKESLQPLSIQCKLFIGAVNDPLEQEADTMADKVMSMQQLPSVTGNNTGNIQRACADCEEADKLQRKPLVSFIQRKESATGNAVASDAISNKINASKGSGSNIDAHTQSFMQNRFGTDFSNIKIHTGEESIQMNRELNAKAFTVGNDIYFNEGQYNPGSAEGKHLLAHELTHTVQQNETSASIVQKAEPDITTAQTPLTADPVKAVTTETSTVVDDLKKNIEAKKITFDSDSKKKELLGENTGVKTTELLQKLILYISNQKDIKISSIIRSEGHHGTGRAVDIGNEDIAKDLLPAMATDATVKEQNIDELIFDAAIAGETDRNKWNYDQGKKHTYGTSTLDDHKDHIHFAVKAG